MVSVVVQRSAFFQTGGFVSFDSRLAALSASLSPPSTQQQHSDRAVAAAAARSSLGRVQWQVLLLAPCFEQSRGVTRFTYSQVYSLETDFTEPCSEHALIRGGVGKMGGELLLAFLGLLALVHGEIVGYVDVPIQ